MGLARITLGDDAPERGVLRVFERFARMLLDVLRQARASREHRQREG